MGEYGMIGLPFVPGEHCRCHSSMLFLDYEVLGQIGAYSLCTTTCSRRTVYSEGVFVQRAGGGRQINLVLLCLSGCGIIRVTDRHGVLNVRLFWLGK